MSDPIAEAVEALARGELVVMPTDTVYGLCARPDLPEATTRVFEVKGRPSELTLPVLVPSFEAAGRVADLDDRAARVAQACWPGAVTIVAPRAEASRSWDLRGDPDTVGVRMPDHPLALEVLRRSGPLAATSANRSGEPTPTTCDELAGLFGDAVAVYLCQQEPLGTRASTVLDLAHGQPAILRSGPADEVAMAAASAAGPPAEGAPDASSGGHRAGPGAQEGGC